MRSTKQNRQKSLVNVLKQNPHVLRCHHQNVKWNVNGTKCDVGNGKRETKPGKWKVQCFRYHEVKHAKSGKSKEGMKRGKLGMGGLREAVGVGLPTRNDQNVVIPCKKEVAE